MVIEALRSIKGAREHWIPGALEDSANHPFPKPSLNLLVPFQVIKVNGKIVTVQVLQELLEERSISITCWELVSNSVRFTNQILSLLIKM